MKRGLLRRCPNCGEGRLFAGYLKVASPCAACDHDNARYPADDGPAYFTIFLVGHLVIAPGLATGFILTWPIGWVIATVMPLLVALTLALLPFVKGAVIGLLWAVGSTRSAPS
jgi:uncharacterized protein (DUF983 family)